MRDSTISFAPLETTRLFEAVCDRIKSEVVRGVLKPGDKLPPERKMAEQFRVSRSVVREALRALEVSGIVELKKGASGGAFLLGEEMPLTLSLESLLSLGRVPLTDFTEARVMLMELVIRLVCERASEVDFEALDLGIDELERAIEQREAYRDLKHITGFYDLLAVASGNAMLRFLTSAIADILSGMISQAQPAPIRSLPARRRAIVHHLRLGEADIASTLMHQHLMDVHARLNLE